MDRTGHGCETGTGSEDGLAKGLQVALPSLSPTTAKVIWCGLSFSIDQYYIFPGKSEHRVTADLFLTPPGQQPREITNDSVGPGEPDPRLR